MSGGGGSFVFPAFFFVILLFFLYNACVWVGRGWVLGKWQRAQKVRSSDLLKLLPDLEILSDLSLERAPPLPPPSLAGWLLAAGADLALMAGRHLTAGLWGIRCM